MVRTPACHAGGRRFEPVLSRHDKIEFWLVSINAVRPPYAAVAQSVERILGKDEVTSSNLVSSSKISLKQVDFGEIFLVLVIFYGSLFLRVFSDPHRDP